MFKRMLLKLIRPLIYASLKSWWFNNEDAIKKHIVKEQKQELNAVLIRLPTLKKSIDNIRSDNKYVIISIRDLQTRLYDINRSQLAMSADIERILKRMV